MPAEFNDPDDVIESQAPEVLREETECWRCGKLFDIEQSECEFCLAKNRSYADKSVFDTAKTESPAIVKVVWAFAWLAAVSLICSAVFSVGADQVLPGTEAWAKAVLVSSGIIEFLDTIIVIGAFFLIRSNPVWPQISPRTKLIAWLTSVPLLALVLALNVGYHSWLAREFQIESGLGGLASFRSLMPWTVLVICVQPAVVEEFFFRRLAMGSILEATSPMAAILISSVLFALAHLGSPLSIPTLTMIGMALGYLRLASGGLLLPVLFHFLHNLAVLFLEIT